MSKKTATKKTKKPTQLHRATETRKKPTIADDLHVLKESFEAQAEFLIDWRRRMDDKIDMLGQRIDAMRHEQVALSQESRSAPAEEWPKVGSYITVLDIHPCERHRGKTFLVDELAEGGHAFWGGIGTGCGGARRIDYRPATSQEIADHKAKEEQRVRDDERAKELAKKLEFGTPVRLNGLPNSPYMWVRISNGRHVLINPDGITSHSDRSEFQIID